RRFHRSIGEHDAFALCQRDNLVTRLPHHYAHLRHRNHLAVRFFGQRADRVVGAVLHQLGPERDLDCGGNFDRDTAYVEDLFDLSERRIVDSPGGHAAEHDAASAGVLDVTGTWHVGGG